MYPIRRMASHFHDLQAGARLEGYAHTAGRLLAFDAPGDPDRPTPSATANAALL
ncbi:MAG: hypothetical protein ABI693_25230 [Bryobacteraceae bacterium]